MTQTWYPLSDDDELKLPTTRIVCPRCKGEGKHVNPAIDGQGISASDECWDDDDFRENYFGGLYDVVCEECDGRNVIDVVDEDALERADPELHSRWLESCADWWNDRQIAEMERRYGA